MNEYDELFVKISKSIQDDRKRFLIKVDDYIWSVTFEKHGLVNKKTPIKKIRLTLQNSKNVEVEK